jgi:hypothetical protein
VNEHSPIVVAVDRSSLTTRDKWSLMTGLL